LHSPSRDVEQAEPFLKPTVVRPQPRFSTQAGTAAAMGGGQRHSTRSAAPRRASVAKVDERGGRRPLLQAGWLCSHRQGGSSDSSSLLQPGRAQISGAGGFIEKESWSRQEIHGVRARAGGDWPNEMSGFFHGPATRRFDEPDSAAQIASPTPRDGNCRFARKSEANGAPTYGQCGLASSTGQWSLPRTRAAARKAGRRLAARLSPIRSVFDGTHLPGPDEGPTQAGGPK